MNPSQNDSFGSFSNGQGGGAQAGGYSGEISSGGGISGGQNSVMPMGSGMASGPVVLNGGGGRRSKKWVVILVALLFLGVAVGVVLSLSRMGGGEKGLVNKYINLLAYDKESTNKLNGELLDEIMAGDEGEETIRNIGTFYLLDGYDSERGSAYYKALKNALGGIEKAKNTQISALAKSSSELLPRYFVAAILANTDAIYFYFIENKGLNGFLSEYDYPFAEPTEESVQGFDNIINQLIDTEKEKFEKIAATGCIENSGVNYICLEEVDSEEISSLIIAEGELNAKVYDVSMEAFELIINKADEMMQIVDGEKQ